MATSPAAQTNPLIDPILLILRDNIRVYDEQMKSFEKLRHTPYPQAGPGQDEKTILSNQLKIQILASFAAISELRSEQRQICQDCIDRFNQLPKIQSPEEFASFRHHIGSSLSRIEKLEQDFLKCAPILEEAKHMQERTVTKI